MAIYCPQCGKELPDDAQFCMKCGKPLTAATQTTTQPEPQWEYCEVYYDHVRKSGLFTKGIVMFWAEATGPKGQYSAGRSADITLGVLEDYPYQNANGVLPAFNAFIEQLSKDGWEQLPINMEISGSATSSGARFANATVPVFPAAYLPKDSPIP